MNPQTMSDSELMTHYITTNAATYLAELARRYDAKLRAIVGDDAASDAWLKLMQYGKTFKGGAFWPWLRRIASNALKDFGGDASAGRKFTFSLNRLRQRHRSMMTRLS